MATSAYIIWDFVPEVFPSIFENLFIHPRWYGVLFALGFLIGYQIMKKIFIKEKENVELVDSLLMYVMLGTVLGARLGHVLFYDLADYLENPISILYVWEGGLASHGAVIGNITAIWLWSRKFGKHTLWSLDRVVITIAIAGALIRTGNFLNSEIYGDPTGDQSGIIYAQPATGSFVGNNGVSKIETSPRLGEPLNDGSGVPVQLTVYFDKNINSEKVAADVVENYLIYNFKQTSHIRENIFIDGKSEAVYNLKKEKGQIIASIEAYGVPRFATQIHEAIGYLCIFIILVFVYLKEGLRNRKGFIFGSFLVAIFGFRFAIEFVKANQSAFEEGLTLNMGQILSIPCVLVGLFFMLKALKEKSPTT